MSKPNYLQTYRKEWENIPKFSDWLQPVPVDKKKAFCRYCKCVLRAKLYALKLHSTSRKHFSASQGLTDTHFSKKTMGRMCSVPGCTSNYHSSNEGKITTFSFPANKERREQWIRAINREDLEISKYTSVCIKHFTEDEVLRVNNLVRPDGSILSVPRVNLRLSEDAVPTIFPAQPTKRQTSVKRKSVHKQKKEVQFNTWHEKDDVINFEDLLDGDSSFCAGESVIIANTSVSDARLELLKLQQEVARQEKQLRREEHEVRIRILEEEWQLKREKLKLEILTLNKNFNSN